MNYFIEWQLYSSKGLISPDEKNQFMLFNWFYINNDTEWLNLFKSPLKNYFKYNYKFYFSNDLITDKLNENERMAKTVIQDNLEIELNFYCLCKDISLISWIYTWIKEYQENDKFFHKINYIINDKFCWNYHRSNNKLLKEDSASDKYFWYKFRLSNLEICPTDNSDVSINWIDYLNKQFNLNLKDEEILKQLHYYNNWLFLEKNWFMSDAFNYFYKIIELEEEKIWNVNIIKEDDLENKIEEFRNRPRKEEKDINLEAFFNKIRELKLKKSKEIRKDIFDKYGLKWNLEDFEKLWQIRWKFSHKWDINYVYLPDFLKCKKFVFDIIFKKITN